MPIEKTDLSFSKFYGMIEVVKDNTVSRERIRTIGLAGGLLTPYKGLLPALESKDSLN